MKTNTRVARTGLRSLTKIIWLCFAALFILAISVALPHTSMATSIPSIITVDISKNSQIKDSGSSDLPATKKTALENASVQISAFFSILTNVLLGLLFILIIILIIWEWRRKTVTIEQIDIPKSLEERGYTGTVIAQHIADHIFEIQRLAKVQRRENSVETSTSQVDFQVPVAKLPLRTFVRYIKQFRNISDRRIKGEIVEGPNNLTIKLHTSDGKSTPLISVRSTVDLPRLTQLAAEAITLLSDPYLAASFWFFKEQPSRNFENSLKAVKYCLAHTPVSEHKQAYAVWGNILTVRREFDEAAIKYKTAVELDSKYAAAYNNWGNMLRQRRSFSEAIEKYQEAIGLDHEYAFAFNNKALVYVDQRDFEPAIDNFVRAIKISPRYASAYGNLGRALVEIGDFKLAELNLRRAIDLDPELIWPHIQMAYMLRRMRRRAEAIEKLEDAKSIDPNLPNIYGTWGDVLFDEYKYAEAIEQYEKALEVDPNYYWAFLGWAQSLRRMQRPDEAIEKISQASEMEPKLGVVHSLWGEVLIDIHRYDEAVQHFQQALAIETRTTAAYRGWGRALIEMNRPDLAIPKLQRAHKIEPCLAATYLCWGDALLRLNQVFQAIEKYDQALSYDCFFLWGLCGAGYALRSLWRRDEAGRKFAKANEIDGKVPAPLIGWGHTLCDGQRYDEAMAKFDEVLNNESNNIPGLLGRVRVLRLKKTPEGISEAEEICHRVISIAPWNTAAYRELAELYLSQKDPEKAVAQFRNALTCKEYDLWARLGLGRALRAKDKMSEARDVLHDCVQRDRYFTPTYLEIARIQMAEKDKDKDYEGALKTFQDAALFNKENPGLYLDWGNALSKVQRYKEAYSQYRKAQLLAPGDDRIKKAIAEVLKKPIK